ncbi:MAG: hypothetical protein WCK67_06405 [bacterium]
MITNFTNNSNIPQRKIWQKQDNMPSHTLRQESIETSDKISIQNNNKQTTEPLNNHTKSQVSFKGSTVVNDKGVQNTVNKQHIQETFDEMVKKNAFHSDIFKKEIGEAINTLHENTEIKIKSNLGEKIIDAVFGPIIELVATVKQMSNPELRKQNEAKETVKQFISLADEAKDIRLTDALTKIAEKETKEHIQKLKEQNPNIHSEVIDKAKKTFETAKKEAIEKIVKGKELTEEVVQEHLKNVDFSKVTDYLKEKWQGKGSTLGILGVTLTNRVVAGALSAAFLGVDFYNTTRMINDDPKKASEEAHKRVAQEALRLGITVYMTSIVTKLFQKTCNSSIVMALGINALVVAGSEIIGRKLIGNDVLPMSKERFELLKSKGKLDNKEKHKESAEKQRLDNPPVFARKIIDSSSNKQGQISDINRLNMIKGGTV